MTKEDNRIHPYPIRLTKELREQLEATAKANGRSLNAEMILRLEASFTDESINNADLEAVIRRIATEILREELTKAGKG
jgi:molybdopterin-guanine dinucleotide biosynthesis protein A